MKMLRRVVFAVLAAGVVTAGCSSANNTAGHSDMNHTGHSNTETSAPTAQAVWEFANTTPQPSKNEELSIRIQDNTGKPIDNFETEMTKKMHLIVVSKDLSFFNHIHPEYQGQGQFKVTTQFPTGGEYELISDFTPAGGAATHTSHWVTVRGDGSNNPVVVDQNLTKAVDGKDITLSFDGKLEAKKPMMMTFHMTESATKKPITNLEPYLGTIGHVVILSSDATDYLHVHPVDDNSTGPDAMFHTEFLHSGVYKIWGQFQQAGKVFTVPFVVQVP